MKVRPILFSAPMVRALLEGRKTQTRRAVKGTEKWPILPHHVAVLETRGTAMAVDAQRRSYGPEIKCPYGQPGDRLWVRETWRCFGGSEFEYLQDQLAIHYRADEMGYEQEQWRPSIFMPRWASRITLEIISVRVERLQDINVNDAISEGLKAISKDGSLVKYGIPDCDGWPGTDDTGWPWRNWCVSPVDAYRRLWESINGPGSWDANPWVWVLEFRRVTA